MGSSQSPNKSSSSDALVVGGVIPNKKKKPEEDRDFMRVLLLDKVSLPFDGGLFNQQTGNSSKDSLGLVRCGAHSASFAATFRRIHLIANAIATCMGNEGYKKKPHEIQEAYAEEGKGSHENNSSSSSSSSGGGAECERIAVLASDTHEGMELMFAVTLAGCPACALNRRWSVREMVNAANIARCNAVVHDAAHADAAAEVARQVGGAALAHGRLLHGAKQDSQYDDDDDFEDEHDAAAAQRIHTNPIVGTSEEAFVVFTSGTTGAPKAAKLSHAAVCRQSAAKLAAVHYDDRDVYLHNAPLFHVGGLSSMHAAWEAKCKHVLYSGGYSAAACIAELTHPRVPVTAFIAVPAMLVDLLEMCNVRDAGTEKRLVFPSLRRVLIGGGAMTHAKDVLALRRRTPNAQLVTAYGLTEATSSVTFSELRMPTADAAQMGIAVGTPGKGIELALRRDDGTVVAFVPDAGRGEVLVRGGIAMLGYAGDDVATAAAFHGDWLRTGDVGSCDAQTGELRLHGRLSERIRSGGESVEPMEVEAALATFDAARLEWAVVGIPDRRLGHRVCAVYCLRAPTSSPSSSPHASSFSNGSGVAGENDDSVTLRDVTLHCRHTGLANYKLPRALICTASLPRNANGKLLRRELARDVAAALDRSSKHQNQSKL